MIKVLAGVFWVFVGLSIAATMIRGKFDGVAFLLSAIAVCAVVVRELEKELLESRKTLKNWPKE